jgi:hypothetical protein
LRLSGGGGAQGFGERGEGALHQGQLDLVDIGEVRVDRCRGDAARATARSVSWSCTALELKVSELERRLRSDSTTSGTPPPKDPIGRRTSILMLNGQYCVPAASTPPPPASAGPAPHTAR